MTLEDEAEAPSQLRARLTGGPTSLPGSAVSSTRPTCPEGLFNASLQGNTRRANDIREGDEADEGAFEELVRAAVALNVADERPWR